MNVPATAARQIACIWLQGALLFASSVQAAQNCGHFLRVLLFLFVLGPLRILIRVLLRAVSILLLNSNPLHVVRVHDLLDAPVVVKDRESWHLVKVLQVGLISVASLDEGVPRRLQRVSLHACVLHAPGHPLSVGLLGPVRPLVVIEGLGAEEFAVEDLRLAINVVFNRLFTSGVVACLMHREGVVLDVVLAVCLIGWHKRLLVHLANGLSELVSNDVPVTDLLADRRVMDKSTFNRYRLVVVILGQHRLLVLQELALTSAHQACCIIGHKLAWAVCRRTRRTQYAIVHVLQVIIGLLLVTLHDLAGGVAHDKLVRGHAMVMRPIRGGPSTEG